MAFPATASVPKATTIAMITTSPALIISRSPAAGSAKFKSLRSNPQRRGAKGSWTFCHKRMTPTRRASTVPKAAPTMPQPKRKMATEENRAFNRLVNRLTYIGRRGLLATRTKEPKVVINPKRTMVPPTKER